MHTEAPLHSPRPQRASSTIMLIVAGLLLALATGLFMAQNAQGSAHTTMQAVPGSDSQQQGFGSVPPAPTPPTPPAPNLIAYMPLIFNERLVVVPPDIGP